MSDDEAPAAEQPKKKGITRRGFLRALAAVAAAGAGGAGYMHVIEPRWFDVHEERISLGLSAPVRLLHLSDFHAGSAVPFSLIERAVELGLEAKPDLVCLTGDFITYELPDMQHYAEVLARLSSVAPTYAVLGNHDGGSWPGSKYDDASAVRTMLGKAGVAVLHNESTEVTAAGQRLRLIGVGDWWNQETAPADVLGARSEADALPRILLNHNPDAKELLQHHAWELMLCGHTHGGQLRIPLLGTTPFAPVVDKRYIAGVYDFDGRKLHITKGVGNLHGMRFNCRPQVSTLVLE